MRWFAIFSALLLGIFLAVGLFLPSEKEPPSREIALPPPKQKELAVLIQSKGFNCPLAKIAYAEGIDAYGDVTHVYCGPSDKEGIYAHMSFRVTTKPNGFWIISPW